MSKQSGKTEKTEVINDCANELEKVADSGKIIDSFVSKYHIVYVVNMVTDTFRLLRMDSDIIGYGKHFNCFTDAVRFFISILPKSDRKKLKQELNYDNIRKKLSETKSYSIEYRVPINSALIWHEMIVTRIDDEHVAIGFDKKDIEITQRHLEKCRYNEYLALYEVDIDSDTIKVVKSSPFYGLLQYGTAIPYSASLIKFAQTLDPEYCEFFTKFADLEYVKELFGTESKYAYSYRSNNLQGKTWVECTSCVTLRHDDGSPAMFALGFCQMDSLGIKRQELQKLQIENMQMIGGLASEYSSLFYVNINEGIFSPYTIDETKYPQSKKPFVESSDFFEVVRTYGQSVNIHPADRHLFTDFTPEWVRSKLTGNKKFSIRFRAATEIGYRWDEMDVVKYEGPDEEANAIAVGFADRDNEIRKEQERQRILQDALDSSTRETFRNDLVMSLFNASKWSYEIDSEDRVVASIYADRMKDKFSINAEDPMAWLQAVHPDDREHVREEFMNSIRDHSGKSLYDVSFRALGKEGRCIWVKSAGKVFRRPDGTAEFIGMSLDISAQLEAQQKRLLGAVPLSSDILTKANIGMWAFELDEGAPPRMYADQAMLSLIGLEHPLTPEETYHAWYDHIDKNSYNLVADAVAKMAAGEHAEVQYPWHHPDGHVMVVRCGGVRNPEYTKGTRIEGTHQNVSAVLHFDEEETKRAEKQRKAEIAKIAAESANKAKTDFLFNMSHDIRTPMNAIMGFTVMAKKNVSDQNKVIDYLGKIDTSGQQLLTLINKVLEMARIESGKIELEEKPVNILKEYNAMVSILNEQTRTNGQLFSHGIDNVNHFNVFADEARTNSIVLNIVGNAVKYTPEGGTIEYRIKEIAPRKEDYATFVLTVSDTGIGMSEDFLKKIFEPFSRENTSTVSRIQGTGLGMSIVKRYVDLMGGNIEVFSERGKGTKFEITLDFKIDKNDEKTEEVFDTHIVSLKDRRILLVEDNELNREIAVNLLQEEGLIVDEADDGSKVIDILMDKGLDYYDGILMDIQMPIMNGYEATKAIRSLFPSCKIPIIALSANAFEEDRNISRSVGMTDHIAKPIDVQEFFNVLAKYL